jgi:hypothetical protein
MRRHARGTPLLLALLLATPVAAAAQESIPQLLQRAIDSAGGAARLAMYRAYEWEATATVNVPGTYVHIAGTWRIQPPDSAIAATYPAVEGPAKMRRLILAGARGWVEDAGRFRALPAAALMEERHQFYLYWLLQLAPLRDSGFTLTEAEPDSAGHRGVLVRRAHHPDVTLYFGTDARVAGLATVFATSADSGSETQTIAFSGTMLSNGVRWFQQMTILRGGMPYYETELTSFRVMPRLADPLLKGPPPEGKQTSHD